MLPCDTLEYEYLLLLSQMAETPGLYHLDGMRRQLHDKLAEKYGYARDRLALVFQNLDKLIDFKPPLEPHDHLAVYARDLQRLLGPGAGRRFLLGELHRLVTLYGEVVDDIWNAAKGGSE